MNTVRNENQKPFSLIQLVMDGSKMKTSIWPSQTDDDSGGSSRQRVHYPGVSDSLSPTKSSLMVVHPWCIPGAGPRTEEMVHTPGPICLKCRNDTGSASIRVRTDLFKEEPVSDLEMNDIHLLSVCPICLEHKENLREYCNLCIHYPQEVCEAILLPVPEAPAIARRDKILDQPPPTTSSEAPTHSEPCCCGLCGFRAIHKSALDAHVKAVHTKGKYFSCALCNYEAPQKSTVMIHRWLVHKTQNSQSRGFRYH